MAVITLDLRHHQHPNTTHTINNHNTRSNHLNTIHTINNHNTHNNHLNMIPTTNTLSNLKSPLHRNQLPMMMVTMMREVTMKMATNLQLDRHLLLEQTR